MVCPQCNSNPCICSQAQQGYKLSDEEISQLINEVNIRRQENEQMQIKCMMFEEMAMRYKIESENMRANMMSYEQKVIDATGTIVSLVNEKSLLQTKLDKYEAANMTLDIPECTSTHEVTESGGCLDEQ